MRVTTHNRVLREAIREMLREGSEMYMGMSSEQQQDLRRYNQQMAAFNLASIPSNLGPEGFLGKSVYLKHLTDDPSVEAFIFARDAQDDKSATEYLVYHPWDPGNISVDGSQIINPPTISPIEETTLKNITGSPGWTFASRMAGVIDHNFPKRFRRIKGAPGTKLWRLFGAPVEHTIADKIWTGGGMILDTMGALAELAPALAARLHDPRVILALGAVKALDKVWTWGGMAASARNVVDSWNGYTNVSDMKMLDPENKSKKIKAQSAAVALDVIGFLLSGFALYIDSISKDSTSAGAAAELFPVVLKWGVYFANMGMNAEDTLDYVRDIWNDAESVLGPALESAIRTATGEVLQALQFFDKMIHT